MRSSLGLARKPSRRPGWYCIRRSRVLISAVSWPVSCLTGLASDRFRFDRRARVQDRLQLRDLRRSELARRAACPPGRQRRLAARSRRPPPPVHRHPRHPEPPRDLPVVSPRLDHLGCRQPHLLPAGPLRRAPARRHRDTLCLRHTQAELVPDGVTKIPACVPGAGTPAPPGEQEVTRAPQPGGSVRVAAARELGTLPLAARAAQRHRPRIAAGRALSAAGSVARLRAASAEPLR